MMCSVPICLGVEAQPVCRIGDSHLLDLLQGDAALEHAWQNIHLYVMVSVAAIRSLH